MVKVKRLQKSEIEKIKELNKLGWIQKDLAKRFGVSRTTIRYHIDTDYKKLIKKSSAKRKKLPEEKEKANKRMKRKYHKDKDFRKKQIERSKKYNTENIDKRKQINQRYWEKNKNKITEQRIKKMNSEMRKTKIIFGVFLLLLLTTISITFILVGVLILKVLGV